MLLDFKKSELLLPKVKACLQTIQDNTNCLFIQQEANWPAWSPCFQLTLDQFCCWYFLQILISNQHSTAWHIQRSEKNIQHCHCSDSLFSIALNSFLLMRIIDVPCQCWSGTPIWQQEMIWCHMKMIYHCFTLFSCPPTSNSETFSDHHTLVWKFARNERMHNLFVEKWLAAQQKQRI